MTGREPDWVVEAGQWKERAYELARKMDYAQLEAWARALNGEDVPARLVYDLPPNWES